MATNKIPDVDEEKIKKLLLKAPKYQKIIYVIDETEYVDSREDLESYVINNTYSGELIVGIYELQEKRLFRVKKDVEEQIIKEQA